MNLEPVRRVLDALGVRYALIGAHAMAARGYPRFTLDVDLLTTDVRILDEATGPPSPATEHASMCATAMRTIRWVGSFTCCSLTART